MDQTLGVRRVPVTCDFCGGAKHRVLHPRVRDYDLDGSDAYDVVECVRCGLACRSPAPHPDDMQTYYPSDYNPFNPAQVRGILAVLKRTLERRKAQKLLRLVGPQAGILDVGCSYGGFLARLRELGATDLAGIDTDARSIAYARDSLGLRAAVGSFEDLPEDRVYDCVVMKYVLDHLPSAAAAFEKLQRILRPGGILVLQLPNRVSWEAKILGRYWHGWEIPRHAAYFTPADIERYAARYGLRARATEHEATPNNWIWGLRYLALDHARPLARFCTIKNPLLVLLASPLGALAALVRRSGRVEYTLQRLPAAETFVRQPRRLISKNRALHSWGDVRRFLAPPAGALVAFEAAFAEAVGAAAAVLFPYCRVAIRTVLETLRPAGTTVLLPSYTCSVVGHAVVLAGYEPRFVDIDPLTYNAPAEAFLDRLDVRTAAVIPTHMYGTPMSIAELDRGATRPLLLIEDAALGIHPAYRSQNPLVRAVTVYSFGSNKHLSTIRGGMVVSHDVRLAEQIRTARDAALRLPVGRDRLKGFIELLALHLLFRPAPYAVLDRFRHTSLLASHLDTRSIDTPVFPGDAGVQLTDSFGVLGLWQLRQREAFMRRRRALASRYAAALRGVADLQLMSLAPESHLSHYTVRVPDRDRRLFRERMRAAGVEVGRTFDYALPDLPPYRRFAGAAFLEARAAAAEVINLPNYPALSEGEFTRVVEAVRRIAVH